MFIVRVWGVTFFSHSHAGLYPGVGACKLVVDVSYDDSYSKLIIGERTDIVKMRLTALVLLDLDGVADLFAKLNPRRLTSASE